jgi:hypothetical protein
LEFSREGAKGTKGDVVVGFIVRRAGGICFGVPSHFLNRGFAPEIPPAQFLENCATLAGVLFRRRVEKRGAI